MSSRDFYLIGDDPSTAKAVLVEPKWKIEDLKRAVGLVLHVAQPLGMLSSFKASGLKVVCVRVC